MITSTPMTDRWIKCLEKRELIKDFLNFANEHGADLTKEVEADNRIFHVPADYSDLLDQFFGIDQQKMEEERVEMLKELKEE